MNLDYKGQITYLWPLKTKLDEAHLQEKSKLPFQIPVTHLPLRNLVRLIIYFIKGMIPNISTKEHSLLVLSIRFFICVT